ncbi:MAG: integrin alpha, partial [Catalinimonas sp.]
MRFSYTTLLWAVSLGSIFAQVPNGTVFQQQVINAYEGGFDQELVSDGSFGDAVANIGDLDGDGTADFAVGAPSDNSNTNEQTGKLWILFMNDDGTVRDEQSIDEDSGSFTADLSIKNRFGNAVVNMGDLDGDGVQDLAVGAPGSDHGTRVPGSVYILYMNTNGTVKRHREISQGLSGLPIELFDGDLFGESLAAVGDLDGDGNPDLAVGHSGAYVQRGAVQILFLNADQTVRAHSTLTEGQSGLNAGLSNNNFFGTSLAALGDLDGNGVTDLAVGAWGFDGFAGGAFVMYMRADGTVLRHRTLDQNTPGLVGAFDAWDYFGWSMGQIGDIDGDGLPELAVGAPRRPWNGVTGAGALIILFLDPSARVRDYQRLAPGEGGVTITGDLGYRWFGAAVAPVGDLNDDRVPDIAVGVSGESGGNSGRGALHLLQLNGLGEASIRGNVVLDDTGDPLPNGTAYLFDAYDRTLGRGYDTLTSVRVA